MLLSGRAEPWEAQGTYQTSPDGEPFSGVSFRIEAVHQRTVAQLCARGPLWAIFAPLAIDADPARMKGVLDTLRAQTAARDFGELAVALTVPATKDKRQRGLRGAILGMLTEEDVMQSSVYELGLKRGEERGELKTVVRLYPRRLGRAISEGERAVLVQRLETLGAERLLDLPLALSAEALAAWLADPAGA